MEKIQITKKELVHLVETAIQFGVDFVDVVKAKPSEKKKNFELDGRKHN